MNEPKKIVVILGNGFDLDLGLKTSYKDFWESEFCPKDYPAPLIHHLNQCWPNNLDAVRWYDLENELLEYYHTVVAPNTFYDCVTEEERVFLKTFQPFKYTYGIYKNQEDIIQSLISKRVIHITDNILCKLSVPYQDDLQLPPQQRDVQAFKLIKEGLGKYIQSIFNPNSDSNTAAFHLLLAMKKTANAGNFINIFTFNYTRLRMRGHIIKDIPVHYMHGCCEDGKIIVGTRDDLEMQPSYDFLMKAMDDSFFPPDIVTALREADEVIIFGHSLGENDRQYFAPFFMKQADYDSPIRKDITIFTRDDNSKIEVKRALQKMTNGKLSALYSINQPIIIRTDNIREDQQYLYDFLVNHQTDNHNAEEVVSNLIH